MVLASVPVIFQHVFVTMSQLLLPSAAWNGLYVVHDVVVLLSRHVCHVHTYYSVC